MKITVLTENTPFSEQFEAEHGLSLYIETENHKILFDTGQTDLFARNAEKLGIKLEDVDIAILSHGHYDHSGGLNRFLEINSKAPVYLSRFAFEPHFSGLEKYIGLDMDLQCSDRLVFTDDFLKIDDELTLYSCNDKENLFPCESFGLYAKHDDRLIPDDFRHEQYLMINENGKKILISGCSHKGILNITKWLEPDILVGGFHFMKLDVENNSDADTLSESAEILNSTGTEFYTCHCTGTTQFEYLKQRMDNVQYISCGQKIII